MFLAANVVLGMGCVAMMWRTNRFSPKWYVVVLSLVPLLMVLLVHITESVDVDPELRSTHAMYRPPYNPEWAREMTAVVAVLASSAILLLALAKRGLAPIFAIATALSGATFLLWV